jgi:low affinity Fe/Cu permease
MEVVMAAKTGFFTRFAKAIAHWSGRPVAFFTAASAVIVWGASGPLFGFSDTWQLVINTSTTIVTFLMVFLIQNTQNRDTEAIQIKLDELIRAVGGAKNTLLDLEEMTEEEIEKVRGEYLKLAEKALDELEHKKTGKTRRANHKQTRKAS